MMHLHVFGSNACVHIPKEQQSSKLANRGCKCMLMGYDEQSKSYQLWYFEDQKLLKNRNVIFNEGTMTMKEPKKFDSVLELIYLEFIEDK